MLRLRQIQLIVDKLTGQGTVQVQPRDLDEPWRTIYRRIGPVGNPSLAEQALWQATKGLEGRHQILDALLANLPRAEAGQPFTSLQELAADLPPIHWLWPDWIPRGMLSLLGAAPGAGKSLLALDLARRIIHDLGFPDGAAVPTPGGNVILVDAEAVPQLQNQRARSWGMDCSRLFLMLPPEAYGFLDLGREEHQDRLIEMAHNLRPELVIVDSLSSIHQKGENSVEDVRAVLRFLSALAYEYDLGLLLIHHLRKGGRVPRCSAMVAADAVSADDFRGSGHIIAMARSVLALSIVQDGPQPDLNGPRRLEVVKTNLCRYPPALGVAFDPPATGSASSGGAPILRYTDASEPYRRPTQTEECGIWLLDLLAHAGEPLRPKEIVAAAKKAGFTRATLYRARKELGDCIVDRGSGPYDPLKTWASAGSAEGGASTGGA
jgi:hypothetical protein